MSHISFIDHIAIVVKDLDKAKSFYEALGLKIDHEEILEERGIKTAFITLKDTKIELITPINSNSEISKFLEKKGEGIHHIAFRTQNILDFEQNLKEKGIIPIYETPQTGAHNSKVNFLHPKQTHGVLMELVWKA